MEFLHYLQMILCNSKSPQIKPQLQQTLNEILEGLIFLILWWDYMYDGYIVTLLIMNHCETQTALKCIHNLPRPEFTIELQPPNFNILQ